MLVALAASIPLAAVIGLALTPGESVWGHLASTVLPLYIRTTLLLMAGVGLGTLVIGAGTAWLVTMCRFPGRHIFEWALLLPMAVPAYVVAYVYTDPAPRRQRWISPPAVPATTHFLSVEMATDSTGSALGVGNGTMGAWVAR